MTLPLARAAIDREDFPAATALLRPLADGGVAEAQFLLGYLYFTSADVSQPESMAWLERAGAQNHAEALYWLSHPHNGQSWDDTRRNLLTRAAELGYIEAQRELGCLYALGEDGFPKDQVLARLWYGRAANQGHADAQYNYGFMLWLGEGGPVEQQAGLNWMRKAADQGDLEAIRFVKDLG